MTEDILFDNIYIGHSVEEAAALAADTWEVKHSLEEAAKKAKVVEEDEEITPVSFQEDPVAFIRQKIFVFVEAAKLDPLFAVKSQPETAAGLALAITTLFGMIGVLLGLIGGQQKPITKVCRNWITAKYLDANASCSLPRRPTPHHQTTRRRRPRPTLLPPPQLATRSLLTPP